MSGKRKTLYCLLILAILPYLFFYNGHCLPDLIEDGEGLVQHFPLRILTTQVIKSGSWPLWDPYRLSGFPLLADIEVGSLYPLNILFFFLPPVVAFNSFMYLHYLLAGIFTFLYLRSLKVKEVAALFSGMAFMFSGFLVTHLGHVSCQNASIWIPAIFLCLENLRQRLSFKYLALAAFAFTIQILAGFPQISLYTALVILLYLGFFGRFSRDRSLFYAGLAILILAGLLSAIQILPTSELAAITPRSRISYHSFASSSFGFKMLPLFLFPNLFGSHSPNFYPVDYWGEGGLVELSPYIGILPICLAFIALLCFRKNDLNIKFWSLVALLAFLLALGKNTPLYRIMYYIPIYNLFRVPARHWFEFNFAIAVLSGIGLNAVITSPNEYLPKIKRTINLLAKILAALVGALLAFVIIFQTTLAKLPQWGKYSFNFSFQNPAIYLPLIIILLSVILLLLLKKRRKNRTLLASILILLFFDLFSFGHFFNPRGAPVEDLIYPEKYRSPVKYILKNEKDFFAYRIITLSSFPLEDGVEIIHPNTNYTYPISSVNGFSAFILNEYQRLLKIEGYWSSEFPRLITNNRILSLLNVKYIISNLFLPGEIELVSSTEKPTMIEKSLSLRPDVSYILSFLAKAPTIPTKELTAGIYGSYFGKPQIKLTVFPEDLKPEYKKFSLKFKSQDILGKEFYLRMSTLSINPIIIDNLRLTEIGENKNLLFEEEIYPTEPSYVKRYSKGIVTIFENKNVLPRAYLVSKIRRVKDFKEASSILWDSKDPFDPGKEALVETEKMPFGLEEGEGECEIINYEPNQITIQTNSRGNKFLILSETYYPGWKAYLNGKRVKIYRTNGVLKGIFIPEGEHLVRFVYDPLTFKMGGIISLVTFIGLISGLIYSQQKGGKRES